MKEIDFRCLGKQLSFKGEFFELTKPLLVYTYVLDKGGSVPTSELKATFWPYTSTASQSLTGAKNAINRQLKCDAVSIRNNAFYASHVVTDLDVLEKGLVQKDQLIILNCFGQFLHGAENIIENIRCSQKGDDEESPTAEEEKGDLLEWLFAKRETLKQDFWYCVKALFKDKQSLQEQVRLIEQACEAIHWDKDLFLFPMDEDIDLMEIAEEGQEDVFSVAVLVYCCLSKYSTPAKLLSFKKMYLSQIDGAEGREALAELKEDARDCEQIPWAPPSEDPYLEGSEPFPDEPAPPPDEPRQRTRPFRAVYATIFISALILSTFFISNINILSRSDDSTRMINRFISFITFNTINTSGSGPTAGLFSNKESTCGIFAHPNNNNDAVFKRNLITQKHILEDALEEDAYLLQDMSDLPALREKIEALCE